jgi:hypothetical protein
MFSADIPLSPVAVNAYITSLLYENEPTKTINAARRENRVALLQTAHASPPRVSRNGYGRATCELGARKCHLKARNLKNAEPYACVVCCHGSGTT